MVPGRALLHDKAAGTSIRDPLLWEHRAAAMLVATVNAIPTLDQ